MHHKTIAIFLLMFALLSTRNDGNPIEPEDITEDKLEIGTFSGYDADAVELPDNWSKMTFRRLDETRYSLVEDEGMTVIKAESQNSSSALVRRIQIDLEKYPVMRWSWKTEQIYEDGDVCSKDGDDYPVRIYVIFDYSLSNLSWWQRQQIRAARVFYGEVPARAMNYIWDTHAEKGTVVDNPYTNLVKMVITESGDENVGQWLQYEVNVLEDYREIYGEDPPEIAAIAIMTDTDDTKSTAVSYFGDISFHKE